MNSLKYFPELVVSDKEEFCQYLRINTALYQVSYA